jgi:hypothetical protein
MTLTEYASRRKSEILAELLAGRLPTDAEYDAAGIRSALEKAEPRQGATRYAQSHIDFEFIFAVPGEATVVQAVRVPAPERIVWLPVPDWVVANVWQGTVHGTYCFESEAREHLRKLEAMLEPAVNQGLFDGPPPIGRA